ncbi:MAG TPA: ECF-type sigma factor [Thermoanaerobaculia bacterium]|nr:ECF-type sigma factor [Thermoanaerobaculia bacterium]
MTPADRDAPADPRITRLLARAAEGDTDACGEVARWAYEHLERLAERRLRQRYGAHLGGVTLEPAAVVNETFLKLLWKPAGFNDRKHFLAFASKVMLRVLIDYDRRRRAEKRGGAAITVTLSAAGPAAAPTPYTVAALGQALEVLDELDERKAAVAKLRLLWGLENAEIARAVEASVATVERDWRFVRSWLAVRLEEAPG